MQAPNSPPTPVPPKLKFRWNAPTSCDPKEYTCGHCDRLVASAQGFLTTLEGGSRSDLPTIRICPNCKQATTLTEKTQIPGVAPGVSVENVPAEVNELYEESRRCVAANCPTASVLASRKLLMNIAVSNGASAGESFVSYVNYLAAKGYVPPNGKDWVDHIRKKGNDANHEIPHMTLDDARELITFSEMLLKFIYEFPSRVPKAPATAPA
jgi:hypothetical protein